MRDVHALWAFMAVCGMIFIAGAFGILYQTTTIFAPKVPQNLTELEQWPEKKLRRLSKSLECRRLPWGNDVPVELQELKHVCSITDRIWLRKYKENKMKGLAEDARKKLKHLHKGDR